MVTLIVIYIANKPADADHPYGHGKAESLASSFEGGAILFAGIWIIVESIGSFFSTHRLHELGQGLALIIFCGVVNGGFGFILLKKGKSMHSNSLISGGQHLITDSMTTLGSMIAVFLVKVTGIEIFDPIIACCLGAYFFYNGVKILNLSFSVLLDAQSDPLLENLAQLFNKHRKPGLIDIHFIRIMRAGDFHHIDLHVAVPEFWSIEQCYKEVDDLEKEVIKEYPVNGEFHFVLEPCGKRFCQNCEVQNCEIREEEFVEKKVYTLQNLVQDSIYKP